MSRQPSSPTTPFPLKEDLDIHLQDTDHQKEVKLIERANRAIKESNSTGITHLTLSTGCILPSENVILRTKNLEDSASVKRTYRIVMNCINCQLNLTAAPAHIEANKIRPPVLFPYSNHLYLMALCLTPVISQTRSQGHQNLL